MKPKLRKTMMILLSVVLIVSIGMLLYEWMQYRKGAEIYEEAEALVELPDLSDLSPTQEPTSSGSQVAESGQPVPAYVDPYADALRNMDFSALQEVNPDVLGWILIPNTPISYPMVQGSDNHYYLSHTWKKWSSIVGAIFMESQNQRDFSDFHTILYGHRMNNGSMFGSLKYYKKQSYWKAHPNIYLTDASGTRKYEIFAAYEVSTVGTTYQLGFPSDAAKQQFLDFCVAQSVIETGIVPSVNDQILTLSTCTGNGHATRWVVQAMLKGTAQSDAAAETVQPSETETDTEQQSDAEQQSEQKPSMEQAAEMEPEAQGDPLPLPEEAGDGT